MDRRCLPIEERPVPQDPFQGTTPTQPFPVGGDQVVPNCIEPWLMPPGFKRVLFRPLNQPNLMVPYIGTRQAPMAYSPQTGIFLYGGLGQPVLGDEVWHRVEPGQRSYGLMTAVDSRTNKIVWQQRSPYPLGYGGGMLATAGGLVFHGDADGNVRACDARTGELCGSSKPAPWAPTARRLSPTNWTANSTLPLHQVAARHRRADRKCAVARRYGVGVQARGHGSNRCTPPPAPPVVQTFEGRGVIVEDERDHHRFHGTGQGHHQTARISNRRLRDVRATPGRECQRARE